MWISVLRLVPPVVRFSAVPGEKKNHVQAILYIKLAMVLSVSFPSKKDEALCVTGTKKYTVKPFCLMGSFLYWNALWILI